MTNNIGLPEDICAHLGDEYDRYMGAIIPPLFQNTLFTRIRNRQKMSKKKRCVLSR